MYDEFCVCIPVRYESSRLPGKPLIEIGGVSVIRRSYQQVLASKYVDRSQIFVITDDQRISDEIDRDGGQVIMVTEPCPNGTERIIKALPQLPARFTKIVNVQGDEPFIDPRQVDFAIERWAAETPETAFCALLHYRLTDREEAESTATVKVVTDLDERVLYYSRALIPGNKRGEWDPETEYLGMIGVYLFHRSELPKLTARHTTPLQEVEDVEQLKQLELGHRMKSYLTPYPYTRSLNTAADLEFFNDYFRSGLTSSRSPPAADSAEFRADESS